MKHVFDGYNHIVKLSKGELLVASLLQFAKETGVQTAWVMGLGGVQWADIGFYDMDEQEYKWVRLDQLLEITSLQGNLAMNEDGTPALHLHGTFSDRDMHAFGGHVKEAQIAGTGELFVHGWLKSPLKRSQDDETGLNLLQV